MKFLLVVLSFCFIAVAQTPPKLKITVVEGEGAINNIKNRVAREPIVQVKDENDTPLSGVVVVFVLPARGAGASFANGERIASVITNEQGLAKAGMLKPNGVAGNFQINVTASHQGQTATTSISQANAMTVAGAAGAGAGGLSATTIGIIVGVAAAAAVGAGVAFRGGGDGGSATISSPAVPGLRIGAAGAPSFGPPR